jgi:hypothetical protein
MTDPKPFVSTTLSSAGEDAPVSSAVLSALQCVEGFDDDDEEKLNTTPKGRAPFATEEDTEAGSRMAMEVASASRSTNNARKEIFELNAALAFSVIHTRGRNLSQDPLAVQDSSSHPVLPQGGQFSDPGALRVEGLGVSTESDEMYALRTALALSQLEPVPSHHGDEGGSISAEATLVVTEDVEAPLATEDSRNITELAVLPYPDPLPVRRWHQSGCTLCLIVLTIALGPTMVLVLAVAVCCCICV